MAEGLKNDLMSRDFRRPGITSEIYNKATKLIENMFPQLYQKINPEIKFIYEIYDLNEKEEIILYANEIFCVNNNITINELKNKIKILDATVASIQVSLSIEILYMNYYCELK